MENFDVNDVDKLEAMIERLDIELATLAVLREEIDGMLEHIDELIEQNRNEANA